MGTEPALEGSNIWTYPAKQRIPACRVCREEEEKMTTKEYVLRSRDVAHILDCSPDEVIELANNKKLKATKVGRFWKYRAADVVAYKKRLVKRA